MRLSPNISSKLCEALSVPRDDLVVAELCCRKTEDECRSAHKGVSFYVLQHARVFIGNDSTGVQKDVTWSVSETALRKNECQ
jgi:hypothetical protein